MSDSGPAEPSSFDPSSTVPSLWREQVGRSACRPAAVTGATELSYAALDARSNQLARVLARYGVVPGDRIAIATDRSAEMLIAFLAVLKLGAAYVPLDMEAPPDRLGFILETVAVRAIVAKEALVSRLPAFDAPVAVLDPALALLADVSADAIMIPVSPGSPAYVMFTSGSTGRPKGIVISHQAVVQLVRGQGYVPFGPDSRFLVAAAPSFDAITFEVWGALLNGATCVIYQPAQIDLNSLADTISAGRVTTCFLATRLFNRIVDLQPSLLAPMRHVLVGGEALSPAHIRRALRQLPGVKLGNGYGPTECTTFACVYSIPSDGHWMADSVPIGFPLAHTTCEILDEALQPVAPGAAGELYIGGTGLALGYFNQSTLTAERFVTLSVAGAAPQRFYRSGDICQRLPGGEIIFLGRRDGQVKLRGFRIELAEIESVLCQHPAVAEAAVALQAGPDGAMQLVAYVVPSAHASPENGAVLRSFLLQRVPPYMCPVRYHSITALPLTPHGKLDRSALPAQSTPVATSRTPFRQAPATPLEYALLAIWQEALGNRTLELDADFFACGGDSLLAMQVIADIERLVGRKLPISALFDASTPGAMLRLLGDAEADFSRPRLRGSGAGVPLFYIPGIYGYSLMPHALTRRLDGVCAYCDNLHFPGTLAPDRPPERMEEIAAAFVAQIRACDPRGTYNLAGYSFAGEIAFEVARQLRASGSEVPHVFLLDSRTNCSERQRGVLRACAASVRYLIQGGLQSRREFLQTRSAKVGRILRHQAAQVRFRLQGKNLEPNSDVRARLWAPSMRAHASYHPQPVDTHGVLLLCTVLPFSVKFRYRSNHDGGWSGLFERGLDIHRLDCTHAQLIVEPMARQAADIVLRQLLTSSPSQRKVEPPPVAPALALQLTSSPAGA